MSVSYPLIVDTGYDFTYIASLVLILGLSSVFEYFFGQASQMLLYAAQRNYIYSTIQIFCTIVSTLVGIYLVNIGASVHVVKLVSALIYAIRPVALWVYVQRKYSIDSKCKPNKICYLKETQHLCDILLFIFIRVLIRLYFLFFQMCFGYQFMLYIIMLLVALQIL